MILRYRRTYCLLLPLVPTQNHMLTRILKEADELKDSAGGAEPSPPAEELAATARPATTSAAEALMLVKSFVNNQPSSSLDVQVRRARMVGWWIMSDVEAGWRFWFRAIKACMAARSI